jgi:hypothetical protein
MAANRLIANIVCPRCGTTNDQEVEVTLDGQGFASGDYRLGDRVRWLPGRDREDGGRPVSGDLDADGYVECPVCERDFFLTVSVRGDAIVGTEVNPAKPGYFP